MSTAPASAPLEPCLPSPSSRRRLVEVVRCCRDHRAVALLARSVARFIVAVELLALQCVVRHVPQNRSGQLVHRVVAEAVATMMSPPINLFTKSN